MKPKIITTRTKYRDCTGQEFTIVQTGENVHGEYINRDKPDFATTLEQVRKQIYLERWEEI